MLYSLLSLREKTLQNRRVKVVIVMASGFGAKGSEGRCYPLWQGFSKVRFRRRTFLLEQQQEEEEEEEEECTRVVFPF